MADPICRWRNSTPKTVCEFVSQLPHKKMTSHEFRSIMSSSIYGDDFFHTPYQLACQLGLYYEDTDKDEYEPRFYCDIDKGEAEQYLKFWISKYYVPNPFVNKKSFLAIEPKPFLQSIVDYIESKGGECDIHKACEDVFQETIGNRDIVVNALNNFSEVIKINKQGIATLVENYKTIIQMKIGRNDKRAFFDTFKDVNPKGTDSIVSLYRPFITAIKSKPFLLLAGISGTGKSRIVRELARACWEEGSEEYKAHKPRNFEMVQVKPNWHDSSELLGYVSRIDGERFVVGPFLKFMVKAINDPNTPYFLCLDEMNLAPVEQYFAEYLSVVESRKMGEDGKVVTDPIIDYDPTDAYKSLIDQLFPDDDAERKLYLTSDETAGDDNSKKRRLTIPQNLIVIGTVNMDETTFSFSRKVLDRAMTIEMNEVDLECGLTSRHEVIGKLGTDELVGSCVEGVDVYSAHKDVCDKVIAYLKVINDKLEGTPFKIAYRTRNEFLLYVVNNLPYNKDENGEDVNQDFIIARALDEITNMKILSRIEGDETKVSEKFLNGLGDAVKEQLEVVCNNLFNTDNPEKEYKSISLAKLDEMTKKLASGYTSFWS